MRVPLTLAALVLTAGAACAQSYQTALPVSPAERRAIEARLSTILENGRPDEVSRFVLPSGRRIAVRPYQTVRRPGDLPCRGYRIDLVGASGTTAVDGFRCQRRAGEAWEIVEPELVLQRSAPPAGDVIVIQEDTPLYPSNDLSVFDEPFAPGAADRADAPVVADGPAPIPRPAPRTDVPDTFVETAPEPDSVDVAALPEPAQTPPPAAEAPAVPAEAPAEPAAPRAPEPDAPAPREVTSVSPPARVVGEDIAPAAPRWSDNADVVGALRDLDYISSDEDDDEETVTAAIDEFAIDERFALPISPEALQERLDAAIDRSELLPVCAPDAPGEFCLENQ